MIDLHMPVVTITAAAVLGLVFAALSVQVVAGRFSEKVDLGPGADARSPLSIAMRCQANFAEYVPLALLLIGLVELRDGPTLFVKVLAAALVLGRVAHPFGMRMKAPNPFRGGGFMLSVLVLVAASVRALLFLV
jgi:uncharacterized membrane protein YecN with MAPEG domain